MESGASGDTDDGLQRWPIYLRMNSGKKQAKVQPRAVTAETSRRRDEPAVMAGQQGAQGLSYGHGT